MYTDLNEWPGYQLSWEKLLYDTQMRLSLFQVEPNSFIFEKHSFGWD